MFKKDACTAERDRCGSAWQCHMLSFPKFSKTHVTKTTRSVLPTLSFLSDSLSAVQKRTAFSSWYARSAKVKSAGLCLMLSPTLELRAYRLACAAPVRVRFRSDLACRERGQVCS